MAGSLPANISTLPCECGGAFGRKPTPSILTRRLLYGRARIKSVRPPVIRREPQRVSIQREPQKVSACSSTHAANCPFPHNHPAHNYQPYNHPAQNPSPPFPINSAYAEEVESSKTIQSAVQRAPCKIIRTAQNARATAHIAHITILHTPRISRISCKAALAEQTPPAQRLPRTLHCPRQTATAQSAAKYNLPTSRSNKPARPPGSNRRPGRARAQIQARAPIQARTDSNG